MPRRNLQSIAVLIALLLFLVCTIHPGSRSVFAAGSFQAERLEVWFDDPSYTFSSQITDPTRLYRITVGLQNEGESGPIGGDYADACFWTDTGWYIHSLGPNIEYENGALPTDGCDTYNSTHEYVFYRNGTGDKFGFKYVNLGGWYSSNPGIFSVGIVDFSSAGGYTISGKVNDASNAPLVGINLTLVDTNDDTRYFVTQTDSAGNYVFSVVAGQYAIFAWKDGYTFSPAQYTLTTPPNVSGKDFIGTSTTTAPPVASFDASPLSGNAPLTVAMQNTSQGSYTSCAWNYGDGTSGSSCATNHDHIFTQVGSYTVTLTVSGSGGADTSIRKNYITVVQPTECGLAKCDDTDGDGLWDNWETAGYNGVDLKALGANPFRKDIFVYVDWLSDNLHTHKPDNLDDVIKAFDIAPVFSSNSLVIPGINLHIIWGKQILETDDNKVLGQRIDSQGDDIEAEFQPIMQQYFPAKYRAIAHYSLFGHSLSNGAQGISPQGRQGSNWLITAINDWEIFLKDPSLIGSLHQVRLATFMHELGHNLGLGHGGVKLDLNGQAADIDRTENKPNHLSIMNYLFSTRGLRPRGFGGEYYLGKLDYSRFTSHDLQPLNESDLSEPNGLGTDHTNTSLDDLGSKFFCGNKVDIQQIDSVFDAVNWDCNPFTRADNPQVSKDINADGIIDTNNPLTTMDEWAYLVFSGGGAIGHPAAAQVAARSAHSAPQVNYAIDLTIEEDKQLGPYPYLKRRMNIFIPFIVR